MDLADILPLSRIHTGVRINSKKRSLEYLSGIFAHDLAQVTEEEILESLRARERLGTTAFGNGVAIPHARMSQAAGAAAAFIQLDEGIDFGALDERPVDLIFALVVPEDSNEEHLHILAQIAAILSDENNCLVLRDKSKDTEEKYAILVTPPKERF